MNNTEIWKPVVGYEGYYEVSSEGRVKAVTRNITDKSGKNKCIKEKVLSPNNHRNGYLTIQLSRNNQTKRFYIHRIVAQAFLPQEGMPCVNHIDHDRSNNNIENLEWVTQRANIKHAITAGRFDPSNNNAPKGEAHPHAKLTEEQVIAIRNLASSGMSHTEIARTFGVGKNTVGGIVHRHNWRHI